MTLTLQRHDVAARALDHLRNHVVDKSMLVPDLLRLKLLLVLASRRCSWKMSLKRPSYFLRMVFLVLMYSGRPLSSASLKVACAKPSMRLVGVVLRLRDTAAARELEDGRSPPAGRRSPA